MDYDIDVMWNQYSQLVDETEECTNDDMMCVNCGSKNSICTDMVNGLIVCTQCGTVLENDIIDNRPEWSFNTEDTTRKDPARCGAAINPLLEKSSMSTLISRSNNFKSRSTNFNFMRKLHNQMSMNYVERSRYHVFENISKMAGDSGKLSHNVIEQAKYYYMILSQRKLSRGEIRKGLIACCIMHACRNMNVPRSMREISKMTGVSVPTLNKTTKIF
jgi:transcription initiation factor TFIIB